jgi:hypothetical protein
MNSHKKIFFFFIICIALLVLIYSGLTLYTKYSKPTVPTETPVTLATPDGMVRDTSYTIPDIFPKGLIEQTDVQAITESYTFTKQGTPTQHTFTYTSRRSLGEAQKFIIDYFKKNKITLSQNLSITDNLISIIGNGKTVNLTITLREGDDKKVEVELTTLK